MNLGEARTAVLRRLGMRASDTTMVALVDEALNASHDSVNGEADWKWLYGEDTLAITETSDDIDLPSDCRRVLSVTLESTGQLLAWTRPDVDVVMYGHPATDARSRGEPGTWTQIQTDTANHLRVFPYPYKDDNLLITYVRKRTRLTATTDTFMTPEEFHQIHVEEAVSAAAMVPPTNAAAASAANARAAELRMSLRYAYRGMTRGIQSVQKIPTSL